MKKEYNSTVIQYKDIFQLLMFFACLTFLLPACKKDAPSAGNPIPVTTATVYPEMNRVGYGWNVATSDYASIAALGGMVINQKAFFDDQAARVITDNLSTQGTEIIAGENAESFAKSVSGKLKVSAGLGLFKSSISYFDSLSFRSDYIYSSFSLLIRQKRIRLNASTDLLKQYLTAEFKADAAALTPAQLVHLYGTHVITDEVTGGKVVATYRARTSSTDRKGAASAGLGSAVKDIFDLDISGGTNQSLSATNSDQLLYYYSVGGSSSTPLVGEVALGPTVPKTIQIADWQKTCTADNAVLIDFGSSDSLINLADLIPDATKAAAVRAYITQYMVDNQVKMVDAPPIVYCYYDSAITDWCYSLQNVPTMYGRMLNAGPVFRAYATLQPGTVGIYQYYSSATGDFIYSNNPNATNLSGYVNMGVVFYTFGGPVSGAVPVYEFLYNAKINKHVYYGHYYSTVNKLPGTVDWGYTGLPFYAYSL